MSDSDTFKWQNATDDDVEQLAPDDPDPRGEDRSDDSNGFLFSWQSGQGTDSTVTVDVTDAPTDIESDWEEYYPFPPVRASFQIFSDTVLEPGYRVSVTGSDGETDEEMQEALKLWGANAAIHAKETNEDLLVILDAIIKRRRGQGTQFMEKVGTESDPNALSSVMLHNPATFRQYSRENQAILVQPDDEVDADHPQTPDGDAAAYVQYDESLAGYDDKDPIPFTKDELVKFTYDPDPWSPWGRTLFESIGDHIDSLRKKWNDRDIAIHQTGHPHRIYASENWTTQQATEYATAHQKGDVSSYQDPEDQGTFAGRVDFVSDSVEIKSEQGSVADISDAVMDDINAIFSALPVSRFKIAYEEDINQFVVEPQQEKDALLVDKEREYLETKFTPIFEEKADELAGGSYDGEVEFRIEPDRHENPLRRESFPNENLDAFGSFLKSYYSSGANQDIPVGAVLDKMGFNLEDMQDEFGWEPEELGQIDETSPEGRQQAEAMETGVSGDGVAADGGQDGEGAEGEN